MVLSCDWHWIDEMLEGFGHDHFSTLGFYCKFCHTVSDCIECEFLGICCPIPIEEKAHGSYDIVAWNLEHNRLPKNLEPHNFLSPRVSRKEIPKITMPFWLQKRKEIETEIE